MGRRGIEGYQRRSDGRKYKLIVNIFNDLIVKEEMRQRVLVRQSYDKIASAQEKE